jgi:hypothetical protein
LTGGPLNETWGRPRLFTGRRRGFCAKSGIMDWQPEIGFGLTLVCGFLRVTGIGRMPNWVTWPGISIGLLLLLWGCLPNRQSIPDGPAILLIACVAGLIGSATWYTGVRKGKIKTDKQPTAAETEVNRPYFTAEPQLILDEFNKVDRVDITITNVGKTPANPMFGYTIIYQRQQKSKVLIHPQSFTNDLVVGLSRVIHETSIKMAELEGNQYVFLYLHYTDLNSKKEYSQSFYFERVIDKNGVIEYSETSMEHKKAIDAIRQIPVCKLTEEMVNSGRDEKTFRAAMEQRGLKVRNITEL